ncbi:MAG: hypothetical protein KDD51_07055, partial [Bdellovibrionales bacterium]|nr:hypothetical protein [Bdellovibrionales bacterium]
AVEFTVKQASEFEVEVVSGVDRAVLKPESSRMNLPSGLRFPASLIFAFFADRELPSLQVRAEVRTEVPRGSGLGGSSALAVALCRGLWELARQPLAEGWQTEMLRWVQDFEARFLEVPTGTQDYLAALYGGLGAYRFRYGNPRVAAFAHTRMEELSERLLVLFSGDHHQSGLSNWEIYRGFLENQSGYRVGLSELRDVAERVDGLLRAGGHWNELGQLLNQEWDIRSRVFKVNTPRLDAIIAHLRTLDIFGCKVCGAAQGGSLIVLCDPSKKEAIRKACQKENIQVLSTLPTSRGVEVLTT